jgi:hypothetical protein
VQVGAECPGGPVFSPGRRPWVKPWSEIGSAIPFAYQIRRNGNRTICIDTLELGANIWLQFESRVCWR